MSVHVRTAADVFADSPQLFPRCDSTVSESIDSRKILINKGADEYANLIPCHDHVLAGSNVITARAPGFYITIGKQRRAIALATGLTRGSQRIEHWIWFNRLLIQHEGRALITSADAAHDLGMSRDKWKVLIAWLRDEGWAQVETAYGQGFVWSHGHKWYSTDWQALNAQADAEHVTSRNSLKRRSTVKAAATSRNSSSGARSINGAPLPLVLNPPMEPSPSGAKSTNAIGAKSTNGIPKNDSSTTDLSSFKPLANTSVGSDTSIGSKTSGASAEVEQQASGPAEISEQPTATKLNGAGQGMTIQQAALYRQQRYNKQGQIQHQSAPADSVPASASKSGELPGVDDQVFRQAWMGPPVEVLQKGKLLKSVYGEYGVVDIACDSYGREIWLRHADDSFGSWNGVSTHVMSVEDLSGWIIVDELPVVDQPMPVAVGSTSNASSSVLIPPGSRITVEGSLTELVAVGSAWAESEDGDTVLAHPPGDRSAMKHYKASSVKMVK
jgi:hypothetical protein